MNIHFIHILTHHPHKFFTQELFSLILFTLKTCLFPSTIFQYIPSLCRYVNLHQGKVIHKVDESNKVKHTPQTPLAPFHKASSLITILHNLIIRSHATIHRKDNKIKQPHTTSILKATTHH
jgi:hypothetical protein